MILFWVIVLAAIVGSAGGWFLAGLSISIYDPEGTAAPRSDFWDRMAVGDEWIS